MTQEQLEVKLLAHSRGVRKWEWQVDNECTEPMKGITWNHQNTSTKILLSLSKMKVF